MLLLYFVPASSVTFYATSLYNSFCLCFSCPRLIAAFQLTRTPQPNIQKFLVHSTTSFIQPASFNTPLLKKLSRSCPLDPPASCHIIFPHHISYSNMHSLLKQHLYVTPSTPPTQSDTAPHTSLPPTSSSPPPSFSTPPPCTF